MLDSLGSTLSRATLASFYSRFGKSLDGTLSPDEVIMCLEDELSKPAAQRRQIDTAAGMGMGSGWNTPAAGPTGFSLADNAASGGFDFTGHSQVATDLDDCDPMIETIPGTIGAPDARSAAAAALRSNSHDSHTSSYSQATSMTASMADDETDMSSEGTVERELVIDVLTANWGLTPNRTIGVINIKACPLCHKPRLSQKSEVDIVTHLAICASQDWSSVGTLVVGSFVTSSQAHRKWFTKVINKISNGTYQLGAVSNGPRFDDALAR